MGGRQLGWLGGPLHSIALSELRVLFFLEGGDHERRPDRPRRDAVHPDAPPDEVLSEPLW